MNNSGKLALARAIVTAMSSLSDDEAKVDLLFTSFVELAAAERKSAAQAIAIAEESIKAGTFYIELAAKVDALTKAEGSPLLGVIEALAGLEKAARAAATSLDSNELFGQAMSGERVSAILLLREALARVELSRLKPAASPEGGDRAAAH